MKKNGRRGQIFVFEGGEGAGKTVVIQALRDYLESKKYNVQFFREPGGVIQSEDIRALIMKHEFQPETEMMLFAASRSELLKTKILPLLEEGVDIILDRFLFSSVCYQGIAGGIGIEKVYEVNKAIIGDDMPVMNILLDLKPEVAQARLSTGSREINRFDTKAMEFHNAIREGYLTLSDMFSSSFTVVNADQSQEQVLADVIAVVEPLLQ